jgi:hypothetical protein
MKSSYPTAIGIIAMLMLMPGCSEQGSQSAGEALPAPMGFTEPNRTEAADDPAFAAFDTDANGVLDEDEWQNREARSLVELKNRTFQQIDRDSSGGIDPDEFASARADDGPNASTGRTVHDPVADPETSGH